MTVEIAVVAVLSVAISLYALIAFLPLRLNSPRFDRPALRLPARQPAPARATQETRRVSADALLTTPSTPAPQAEQSADLAQALAQAISVRLRQRPDESPLAASSDDVKFLSALEGTRLKLSRPLSDDALEALAQRLAQAALAAWTQGVTPTTDSLRAALSAGLRDPDLMPDDELIEVALEVIVSRLSSNTSADH